MTELNLIENKEMREQLANRIDVLDKVKELFLLPKLDMMTMQQVADYYEVDVGVVKKCYQRNNEEIKEDGAILSNISEVKKLMGHSVPIVKTIGYTEFQLSDDVKLKVPNRGIRLFPKRAILRIGMLLRDSEVAKEVRTQLLNVYENVEQEVTIIEIENENKLLQNLMYSFMNGTKEDMFASMQELYQYQNKHILVLEEENKEIKESNKMLATEVLVWDSRKSVNKAVRIIAGMIHYSHGYVWKLLYDELRYKHGIGLSQRGDTPYIKHVKDNEWFAVQQSLSAICEEYGISPSYVLKRSKMITEETKVEDKE